jgi:hypothetical protein
MPSSGMLRCVALIRTDMSGELNASIIRVTRIDEQRTTLAVTSNRSTHIIFLRSVLRLLVNANVVLSPPIFVNLIMDAITSSETSVLTDIS